MIGRVLDPLGHRNRPVRFSRLFLAPTVRPYVAGLPDVSEWLPGWQTLSGYISQSRLADEGGLAYVPSIWARPTRDVFAATREWMLSIVGDLISFEAIIYPADSLVTVRARHGIIHGSLRLGDVELDDWCEATGTII